MQNPLPIKFEQDHSSEKNLPLDAKQLLEILDELQDFTTKLRKKLMGELKQDGSDKS